VRDNGDISNVLHKINDPMMPARTSGSRESRNLKIAAASFFKSSWIVCLVERKGQAARGKILALKT
jgi:hypothetical protein